MSWSWKLFTVRGIEVRVHASFVLALLWAGYAGVTGSSGRGGDSWLRGGLFMILFVVLLFVCVVLHELGHSLVAQLFGVQVHDITLWPIGGVARMSHLPDKPYQEFLISAAGPATNILLAIALGVLLLVFSSPERVLQWFASPWLLGRLLGQLTAESLLLLLVVNNAFLALFNLLPAFPMDGGRLLRSFLAALLPFRLATQIASGVGQIIAIGLAGFGLVTGDLVLILVGLFVFIGAWQERQQTAAGNTLRGLCVRDAMQPLGVRAHPLQTLGDVAAHVGTSSQPAYVVVDAGRLVGIMSRSDLLSGLHKAGPDARVAQYMRRGVLQLAPDEPLLGLQERLLANRFQVAMVIADRQVVGMLTGADLIRLAELVDAYPGFSHSKEPQ